MEKPRKIEVRPFFEYQSVGPWVTGLVGSTERSLGYGYDREYSEILGLRLSREY